METRDSDVIGGKVMDLMDEEKMMKVTSVDVDGSDGER